VEVILKRRDATAAPLGCKSFRSLSSVAARCSRHADQEALRIKQLVKFVEKYRRMAVRAPLLLADVGYYEAELAVSRRCLQTVAPG
jgi:hypothetical protein